MNKSCSSFFSFFRAISWLSDMSIRLAGMSVCYSFCRYLNFLFLCLYLSYTHNIL
nr:MAG TPA: hypothetical protein [Bacteriophage sp.]